jgi:hypothetical protein
MADEHGEPDSAPDLVVPAPIPVAPPTPPPGDLGAVKLGGPVLIGAELIGAELSGAEEAPTRRRPLLRRKGFWWSVAASLVLAGDVVLIALISGWRADAADFQSRARDLGERIAISNGVDQAQQKQIDILTSQSAGVSSLSQTVQASADEQATSAHAYRDIALGFQECYDARGEAIAKAWAGASVADSLAGANAACTIADQSSAALKAGG